MVKSRKKPTSAVLKARKKVAKVMHEFKHGLLHSGSKTGPLVKDRIQAIAIALDISRKPAKKRRAKTSKSVVRKAAGKTVTRKKVTSRRKKSVK